MKTIKPLIESGRECMENILASVINHKSSFFPLIYCTTWSFDLINKDVMPLGSLGNRVIAEWGKIEDNAKTYLGIDILFQQVADPHEAYRILIEEIDRNDTPAFTLSMKYCNWHIWRNMENAREHTLIASDHVNRKELVCVDCQPPYEGARLSYDDFLKAYGGLVVIFRTCPVSQDINFLQPIQQTICALKKSRSYVNAFEAMRFFADELEQINFELECPGFDEQDIWESGIFHSIYCLEIGRKQYAQFLYTVCNITGDKRLSEAAGQIHAVSQIWMTIRNSLMKLRLHESSGAARKRLYQLVNQCADKEEDTFYMLEHVLY